MWFKTDRLDSACSFVKHAEKEYKFVNRKQKRYKYNLVSYVFQLLNYDHKKYYHAQSQAGFKTHSIATGDRLWTKAAQIATSLSS